MSDLSVLRPIAVECIKRSESTMDWMTGIVVDPFASGRLDLPYYYALSTTF